MNEITHSHKASNFKFIGMNYTRGDTSVTLQVGDECIIHPIPGVSQATKSYPVVVDIKKYAPGEAVYEKPVTEILGLQGINGNKWGCWLNEYAFGRLEFVKRGNTFKLPQKTESERLPLFNTKPLLTQ